MNWAALRPKCRHKNQKVDFKKEAGDEVMETWNSKLTKLI